MNEFILHIKPDEEDAEAAEILVDGSVDGRQYRFLLDTGAAKTSLAFDEYTALFDSQGQQHSSGVFASKSSDLITVPEITLGPIVQRDFTLARMPESGPALNLIGMDLLKDYCCHFVFVENRVVIDPEYRAAYLLQALQLDKKFHPYIEVQFGERQAQAVWDTGAGMTVVDLGLIEKHPAHFQAAGRSSGTDSTGAGAETPMYILSGAAIGGLEFPPHRVAGIDLSHVNATIETPMNLILGYSTLRNANWLFDFPRQQWTITELIADPI